MSLPVDCDHKSTSIVRVLLRNGTEQIRELCDECAGNVRTLKKAGYAARLHELPAIPMGRLHEAQLAYARAAWNSVEPARMAEQEAKRRAWFDKHDDYLASDKWKALRRKVIERCGNLCEGCRESEVECVHHLTYAHHGDELLFELVGLCHACHGRAHTDAAAMNGEKT